MVEPASLDPFRKERPVVAGARWLEQQGIDVIFVPVPKMTEVYPEYFTDHCPSDRIIAPHVRQAMLELLEADVEVVDLWYAFQAERDTDPEPLYQPADPHWAPRAQAIAARLVAARLKRYEFVAKAQASPPICERSGVPYPAASAGAAFQALNPDQQRRAEENQPRSSRIAQKLPRAPVRRFRPGGLYRRQLQRRVHGAARPGDQPASAGSLRAEGTPLMRSRISSGSRAPQGLQGRDLARLQFQPQESLASPTRNSRGR